VLESVRICGYALRGHQRREHAVMRCLTDMQRLDGRAEVGLQAAGHGDRDGHRISQCRIIQFQQPAACHGRAENAEGGRGMPAFLIVMRQQAPG